MSESRTPSASSAKAPHARKASRKLEPQASTASAPEAVNVVGLAPIDRAALIATAAYFRAERRRFEPGHELEDWLLAEREIDTVLFAGLSEDNPA